CGAPLRQERQRERPDEGQEHSQPAGRSRSPPVLTPSGEESAVALFEPAEDEGVTIAVGLVAPAVVEPTCDGDQRQPPTAAAPLGECQPQVPVLIADLQLPAP